MRLLSCGFRTKLYMPDCKNIPIASPLQNGADSRGSAENRGSVQVAGGLGIEQ